MKFEFNKKNRALLKCIRTINSCNNLKQLNIAVSYWWKYINAYGYDYNEIINKTYESKKDDLKGTNYGN